MSTEKKKISLLNQLLDGAESVIEAAKRPFVIKKIKSAISQGVDGLDEQGVDINIEIQNLRKELVQKPEKAGDIFNKIIKKRAELRNLEWTKEVAVAEKAELLG